MPLPIAVLKAALNSPMVRLCNAPLHLSVSLFFEVRSAGIAVSSLPAARAPPPADTADSLPSRAPQLVELKNGETYNGTLASVDQFMNLRLTGVIVTSKDGQRFWKLAVRCWLAGRRRARRARMRAPQPRSLCSRACGARSTRHALSLHLLLLSPRRKLLCAVLL